jgi:Ca2+-dependent lipid-binding protein
MVSTREMSSVSYLPLHPVPSTFIAEKSSGFPDPFAVATIGGEQTKTTSVIRKTLNPYWNEVFDMSVTSHPTLVTSPKY